MQRKCAPYGSGHFPRVTRSNSRHECAARMASIDGFCSVTTQWWKKAASDDGTQARRKSNRVKKKKSASEKRMFDLKSELELHRNYTTRCCKVFSAPRFSSERPWISSPSIRRSNRNLIAFCN